MKWTWLILPTFLVAACGGTIDSPSGETLADTTPMPRVSFNADWTVTQSAPLVAGQQVIIHYAAERLPRCRAVYQGVPAWNIQLSYAADGGFAQNLGLATPSHVGALVLSDVTITVPSGHDLAVWFLNTDEFGCTDWDSHYGQNFHFAIQPSPTATLHFRRDWSIAVDGTPSAGAPLTVDYDLARLPNCRQDYNGSPTFEVTAHYRYDGGAVQASPLTAILNQFERVAAPARLSVPADAHTLELWFDNVDRTGCHQWDSAFGQNFHFALN